MCVLFSWGLCSGLFALLLRCCVLRCLFCVVLFVVAFVLFVFRLLVWLCLVVVGLVCCVETAKHHNIHNVVVVVGLVCPCFVILCVLSLVSLFGIVCWVVLCC